MAALVGVRVMPPWTWPLLAGALIGATGGLVVRRLLRDGGYRLLDEDDLPLRRTGWLVAALAVACGLLAVSWWSRPLFAGLVLASALALGALSAIDLDVRRLPDLVTLPLAGATGAFLVVLAVLGDASFDDVVRAWAGGIALALAYALLALIGGGSGMGLGDAKLALSLGMLLGYLSWVHLFVGVFASFVTAAVQAVWLVAARGAGRKSTLAFGPHMALGAILVLAAPAVGVIAGSR